MNLEQQVLALQQTAAFRGVSRPMLEALLEGALVQPMPKAAMLFSEGQPVSRVLVLVSGAARTFCLTKQAREFTIGVYSPRAVLGLQAVFQANPSHFASAQMLEAGLVLSLEAANLERLVASDAALANALLRFVVSRSGALLRRVDQVFFADLNARVARLLLEHSSDSGWLLPTNTVLAAELGTVPELVSRKLGEFYRLGLIALEKRRVWVVNPQTLSDLLEVSQQR